MCLVDELRVLPICGDSKPRPTMLIIDRCRLIAEALVVRRAVLAIKFFYERLFFYERAPMDSIQTAEPTFAESRLGSNDAEFHLVDTMEIQSLWSDTDRFSGVELRAIPRSARPRSCDRQMGGSPQACANHPRGWNTNVSHQRKLHSYQS